MIAQLKVIAMSEVTLEGIRNPAILLEMGCNLSSETGGLVIFVNQFCLR
jgi:hypothetical protein